MHVYTAAQFNAFVCGTVVFVAQYKHNIIMPCELVRRHIPSCSSKFDVKIENLDILDVGDYIISETITTTETWVTPFGSVTLPVGHSKNETRISLTVSEIFDRKQEP